MLVKEYRILLPLSLGEYKIAHLYMVAKKSREESQLPECAGVEILVNEPYEEGPGGSGQFTHKLYHFGAYLPACLKPLGKVTKHVHERSWNAYPYTKSTYSWPRMEKFSIEIETIYTDALYPQENIFQLSEDDLRCRIVDVVDIVNDPYSYTYNKEEDPKLYVSKKTARGPLKESWIKDATESFQNLCECGDRPFICAYKLCKVEFKYLFLQSKVEKWIHDNVLRKNILHGSRQAWAWQDEWVELSMADIREFENETQDLLSRKMSPTTPLSEEQKEEITEDDLIVPDLACWKLLESMDTLENKTADSQDSGSGEKCNNESSLCLDIKKRSVDKTTAMCSTDGELDNQKEEEDVTSCQKPSDKDLQSENSKNDTSGDSRCQQGLM